MKRIVTAVVLLAVFASASVFAASRLLVTTGEAMEDAAVAFSASLSDKQKETALIADYNDARRVDWHFIPKPSRKGLQVKEMNDDQRKLAKALLRSALSEAGYDKATKIMAMEAILRELEKSKVGGNIRDPERYYFTIFGKPKSGDRWGLSVEGHHFSVNFVVEKGKVISSTPTFYGANPAESRNDIEPTVPKGTRILAAEEDIAFKLVASLSDEQKKTAIVSDKAPADIQGPATVQPPPATTEGIAWKQLNEGQQKMLTDLITVYANNVPQDLAKERLAKFTASSDKVRFIWAGATKPGVGHYYRIESASFLIELVNVQADAEGNIANHIHSVWRDVAGDFALPATTK